MAKNEKKINDVSQKIIALFEEHDFDPDDAFVTIIGLMTALSISVAIKPEELKTILQDTLKEYVLDYENAMQRRKWQLKKLDSTN